MKFPISKQSHKTSLEELQNKIETVKTKLADLTAREQLLAEQEQTLNGALAQWCVTPEQLEDTIKKLNEEYTAELQCIENQLQQLPPEFLK